MTLTRKLKRLLVALGATAAAPAAFAGQMDQADAFYQFWQTVNGWTGGPLGVGLATTMLLLGGAYGVAKNSPMPALSGVAGAAFLHWGPNVIQNIMVGGGLV
jgi:conjugal transfer pilus assembly protein TraA